MRAEPLGTCPKCGHVVWASYANCHTCRLFDRDKGG